MKSAFESTVAEELSNCVFSITGLMGRVKRFSKVPEIHLQVAHECIARYDSLRDFANIFGQQLEGYDKQIGKAKIFFEYVG